MDLWVVYPLIVMAVPLAVAALKKVATVKPWLIPVLVPLLGAIGEAIAAYVSQTTPSPLVGSMLGMVGLWLREFVDQMKKATA